MKKLLSLILCLFLAAPCFADGGSTDFNAAHHIAVTTDYNFNGGDMIILFWFVSDTTFLQKNPLSKWNDTSGNKQFDYQFFTDQKPFFEVMQTNSSSKIARGSTTMVTGTWHSMVLVADSSKELEIWYNEAQETLQSTPGWDGTIKSYSMELNIGRKATGNQYWDGRIAHVRMFSTANFSSDHYLEANLNPEAWVENMVSYYPLWGDGSRVKDLSVNANHASTDSSNGSSTDGPPIILGMGMAL